ncbi:MAG: hypothetical protein ACKVZJ_12940 [Phycisphaerales bacterium]
MSRIRTNQTSVLRTLAGLSIAAVMNLGTVASAQTTTPTSLTYQGRLDLNNLPANGLFEMRFAAFAANTGGTELASHQISNVSVTNGLFNAVFDFGLNTGNAFNNGTGRWLQIDVRPQGTTTWTALPRQALSSTPYALRLEGISRDALGRWGIGGINTGADFTIRRDSTAAIMVDSGSNSAVEAGYRFADRGTVMWTIQKNAGDNNFGVYRSSSATPAMTVSHISGNIGIGTSTPTAPLQVNGRIKTNVLEILGGADIAEPFDVSDCASADEHAVKPGMLVSIDPSKPGALRLATAAYDRTVAGVISGAGGVNTGMVLRQEGTDMADGAHPVAMTGRVWAYADADAAGAIQPGDMLTTSDVPGHAMKAADASRSNGAVIGKAMTGLEKGRGLVMVLVNLQ